MRISPGAAPVLAVLLTSCRASDDGLKAIEGRVYARLDDVRATSKKELGYFMTLTRMTKAKADANPAFGILLESTLRSTSCQNANYVMLMKAGFGVRLIYTSSDGVEVRNIAIAPKDCKL